MNNTILNARWNEVDKVLSTFYSNYIKKNKEFYKQLQITFNSIKIKSENLYDYASNRQIIEAKEKIAEIKGKYGLKGYLGNQLKVGNKIRNIELIKILIMADYYVYYQKISNEEKEFFEEIGNIGYTAGYTEVGTKGKEPPKPEEHIRLLTVPEAFLLQLIGMNCFNGFKWYDYRDGVMKYFSDELSKVVVQQINANKDLDVYSPEIMKVIKKQEKNYLQKKVDENYRDDYYNNFYGNLDNQVAYIVNQCALYGMKKQGIKKVLFIAVIDEKTTDMCKSLDGQVFNIDGWNEFQRYSGEDKKNIVYKVKGLVTGVNLPPINNNFHYCRSTIYPYE